MTQSEVIGQRTGGTRTSSWGCACDNAGISRDQIIQASTQVNNTRHDEYASGCDDIDVVLPVRLLKG